MILKVFGCDVEVIFEDNLMNEKNLYGYYHPKNKIIKIDSSLKGKNKNHTLCHELFHAVFDRLGFHNTSLSLDMEELIVDNLSQVLIENMDIKWKQHE